jgi:UDP:flavonoid glycosyltransferase YjiC (YdhE family)
MTGAPSLRVLVVTADLGGNLSPALIIASRLIAEGAAVHVLGHSTQRAAVEAAGVTFSA